MAAIRRKFYSGKDEIIFNEIKVDLLSKSVYVNENIVNLTKTEFEILLFFLTHKNHILSKNTIKEHISENTSEIIDNCNSIYSHIKNLKRKLQKAGAKNYIRTVYGLGYKFSE